jgi:hypothetical protein
VWSVYARTGFEEDSIARIIPIIQTREYDSLDGSLKGLVGFAQNNGFKSLLVPLWAVASGALEEHISHIGENLFAWSGSTVVIVATPPLVSDSNPSERARQCFKLVYSILVDNEELQSMLISDHFCLLSTSAKLEAFKSTFK